MVFLLTFLIYKKLHYRIFLRQQSYFTHFSILLLYTRKILLTIPLWFQVILPVFHFVLLLFCHLYAYQYPKPILKTINSEPLCSKTIPEHRLNKLCSGSLAFLLVRYTHHNFPLFLIRYGIVWLLVNLHKNP
ncbi:hypothetical protein DW223_01955 [Butyricicoccus sp. AM18-35]|nr:hypothetical protein DW223_01955 [Butyricicoccus sp. AM18-35]